MEWIDELARTLGAEPLSEGETLPLLQVARDVAHGVERKVTPLASFLLGVSVERRVAAGHARAEALEGAIGDLRALLPPAPA
jgi:hypothetical protein